MDDKEKRGLGQGIGYTVSGILGIVGGIYGGPKAGEAITGIGTTITDVSINAAVPTKQEVPTGQVSAKNAEDIGAVKAGTVDMVKDGFFFLHLQDRILPVGTTIYGKFGDSAIITDVDPDASAKAKIVSGEWTPGQTIYAKK